MDDPLYYLTQIPPINIVENLEEYTKPFSSKNRNNLKNLVLQTQFKTVNLKEFPEFNSECVFYPKEDYSNLGKLKRIYSQPNAKKYISEIYPYEELGNSIFSNRCGTKLANIDAIFNITDHNAGSLNMKNPEPLTYCDICGGPGGFTQYLQYRLPLSMGYGITSKSHIDYQMNKLDISRFVPIYGSNSVGDGNIFNEWDFFIKTVKTVESDGVDIVVADGGFDVSKNEDQTRQEFLTSRLIQHEILMGISCCKKEGNFVCKLFDTVSKISGDLLYLCSLAFEKIYLFKPTTSRWTNAEKYLICIKRKDDVDDVIAILTKMVKMQNHYISLSDSDMILPDDFVSWLKMRNEQMIKLQWETAENLKMILDGKKVDSPLVDLHKFMILLNLPGEI